MRKKLIDLLNKIFAPQVTTTYWVNNKKVDNVSNEVKAEFNGMVDEMERMIKSMRIK